MIIWHLRAGMDRRFRAGHPWVYSNELLESPKGIEPGAAVELRDPSGKFLARGYGNPSSLIAFRAMTRDQEVKEPFDVAFLSDTLKRAAALRLTTGYRGVSHRLCFGEADFVPGLIIDRYEIAGTGPTQAFVVQMQTAGADEIRKVLLEVLERLTNEMRAFGWPSWDRTAVILRNDVGIRKLEGLQEEAPSLLKGVPGYDPAHCMIKIAAVDGSDPLEFNVNLVEGQKTGFFLDQAANVQLAASRIAKYIDKKRVRVLDLFCYAGQWGTQLAKFLKSRGVAVEVTAVDASATALELAKANMERYGAAVKTVKMDIIENLASFQAPDGGYDIVISDPPALIKGRKDIPQGTHAYLQLNTNAMKLVSPGGSLVACSCSALLEEEEFLKTLGKASRRSERAAQWIIRGSQAPDHPMLAEFPEGRYLKAWMGIVDIA